MSKNKESIDWKTTWVSAVGAGGSLSLIGGKGEYLLLFMNLADPSQQLWLRVKSTRLGAVAHGGAGLVVGYMSGVRNAKDVKGLKSSGVDFELDVGARLGAVAKSGRLKKVLEALLKASESRKLARGNIGNAAKRRAKAELGKQYANLVNGDLSADKSGRKFLLLSTPAGAGFGAGVFYEWQSVYTLGGSAWDYAKPKWRLVRHGPKSILLQIKRAPEEDGTSVHVSLFVKRLLKDERLYFRGGSTSTGPMTLSGVMGAVTTFALVDDGSSGLQTVGGINLSRLRLLGTRRHIDERFVYEPIISQKVSVRIEVRANSATAWRSTQYRTVSTDAKGQFSQVHQPLFTG